MQPGPEAVDPQRAWAYPPTLIANAVAPAKKPVTK
jgi:hypothetical protein